VAAAGSLARSVALSHSRTHTLSHSLARAVLISAPSSPHHPTTAVAVAADTHTETTYRRRSPFIPRCYTALRRTVRSTRALAYNIYIIILSSPTRLRASRLYIYVYNIYVRTHSFFSKKIYSIYIIFTYYTSRVLFYNLNVPIYYYNMRIHFRQEKTYYYIVNKHNWRVHFGCKPKPYQPITIWNNAKYHSHFRSFRWWTNGCLNSVLVFINCVTKI